eukprot:NODE_622_length_1490_cov_647.463567_g462_i0.p1 GENE.NODE_622_length_1490_cov_647.463567_g462_i0~~NODE_622_length_1490_cov_647.463567_g462_i0.p1  ORF type:complete len:220 (-),score=30.43 NODE_622_length_1490_cov_647.463567_g462_i0:270-929(-)
MRYKTKMCKNWQQYEKCPYGPRCLFAHGTKEMRSYTVNHTAISSASCATSPERQFYALGHFPAFMPVPFDVKETSSNAPSPTPENRPTTHSPYSPVKPCTTPSPHSSSSSPTFQQPQQCMQGYLAPQRPMYVNSFYPTLAQPYHAPPVTPQYSPVEMPHMPPAGMPGCMHNGMCLPGSMGVMPNDMYREPDNRMYGPMDMYAMQPAMYPSPMMEPMPCW